MPDIKSSMSVEALILGAQTRLPSATMLSSFLGFDLQYIGLLMVLKDKIKLAVIDDHPLMRDGIEETLRREEAFEVLEGGSSAEDAIRIANAHKPHLMVLDINMPGGGLTAARAIGAQHPSVRTVILTVSEQHAHVTSALDAGVRGYVLKGISEAEFLSSIWTVLAGEAYITPAFAARLLALSSSKAHSDSVKANFLHPLSDREKEVLSELSQGLTNKAIAANLNLTEQTIKHYISAILKKMKARNRVEAILAYKKATNNTA
jgi:two-component system, NarL family, nitrate/nitrite response regulator NarL